MTDEQVRAYGSIRDALPTAALKAQFAWLIAELERGQRRKPAQHHTPQLSQAEWAFAKRLYGSEE